MKIASHTSTIILLGALAVPAYAQDLNFVDRYILANGNCQTGVANLSTEPFGKPIDEWTDADLLSMRAALSRCHAKAEWDRWTAPVDQSVTQAYADHRAWKARQQAKLEYEKEQAAQVEQRRTSALAAEKAEAERQERLRADAEREQERRHEAELAARQKREIALDHERRAAIQMQAQRDREAANQAKRLAEQEAPLIAATEKEASEARAARLSAEKALEDVRQKVTAAKDRRISEDAAIAMAEAKRQRLEQLDAERKKEQREDDALAKTCSVSAEQFERVAIGMSLRQVRRVFACTGYLSSSTEIQGLGTLSVYQWDGTTAGAAATTTFNRGRMVAKSQSSLN